MNYDRYLELQTRLEWFYDFHPEFFDDILPEQKKLLQDDNRPTLQDDMFLAVDALYKAAGASSLFDDNGYRSLAE